MPADFDKCVSEGGKTRTVKPNKGTYLHVCYDKSGSHSGEVKHVKGTWDAETDKPGGEVHGLGPEVDKAGGMELRPVAEKPDGWYAEAAHDGGIWDSEKDTPGEGSHDYYGHLYPDSKEDALDTEGEKYNG